VQTIIESGSSLLTLLKIKLVTFFSETRYKYCNAEIFAWKQCMMMMTAWQVVRVCTGDVGARGQHVDAKLYTRAEQVARSSRRNRNANTSHDVRPVQTCLGLFRPRNSYLSHNRYPDISTNCNLLQRAYCQMLELSSRRCWLQCSFTRFKRTVKRVHFTQFPRYLSR